MVRILTVALLLVGPKMVAPKDKWIEIRTDNFHLVSNAGEKQAREALADLEQLRSALRQILPNQRLQSPIPTTVFAFRNSKSYEPYYPVYQGKAKEVASYLQPGRFKNVITIDLSARSSESDELIFRPYIYLMLRYNEYAYPLWFRVGLAEYYGNCRIRRDYAEVGHMHEQHRRTLAESPFIRLKELFEADRNSPLYQNDERNDVFYAESWVVVHFLMFGRGQEGPQQFARFVRLLVEGADHEAAVREALGTDIEELQSEVRNYVRKRIYQYYRFELEPIDLEKDFPIQSVDAKTMEYYIGDLLLNINRLDEAEAQLGRLFEENPDSVPLLESLGFLSIRQNDAAKAEAYLKQAVARDSRNPVAHYYYADTLMANYRSGSFSDIPNEIAEPAIASLKVALEQTPGWVDAARHLSFIYLVEDDIDAGIATARQTLELWPGEPSMLFLLGQLLMKKGDTASAKQAFSMVVRRADGEGLRRSAQQLLEQVRQMEMKEPSSPPVRRDSSPTGSGDHRLVKGTLILVECRKGVSPIFRVSSGEKIFVLQAESVDKLPVLVNGEHVPSFTFKCGAQRREVEVAFVALEEDSEQPEVRGRILYLNLLGS